MEPIQIPSPISPRRFESTPRNILPIPSTQRVPMSVPAFENASTTNSAPAHLIGKGATDSTSTLDVLPPPVNGIAASIRGSATERLTSETQIRPRMSQTQNRDRHRLDEVCENTQTISGSMERWRNLTCHYLGSVCPTSTSCNPQFTQSLCGHSS